MTKKYTYILFLLMLSYFPSFGQCAVPSGIPAKITIIESGKIQKSQNDVKYLSGGVVLQLNDYTVTADSAVIFQESNNFEAYGNVALLKDDTKYITGSTAFYSADAQYLNFMQDVITYYEKQPLTSRSSAGYNVSQ